MGLLKVSVILPTYNERRNVIELIEVIIEELSPLNMEREIIVVDDNSPDNTGKVVQDRFSKDESVKVFIRTKEKGLATAIRYGIEKSTGDIIVVADSDFNHDPKLLPQMVDFLDYYHIIVGSRFVVGGGMKDTFRYRGSFVYNIFIRIILRTPIQDNLSGFFSIGRKNLFSLNFDKIFFGYGDYFFRLLFYAQRRKFKILEVPVFYQLRKYGKSKTNLISIFVRYSVALLKFRLQKRSDSAR